MRVALRIEHIATRPGPVPAEPWDESVPPPAGTARTIDWEEHALELAHHIEALVAFCQDEPQAAGHLLALLDAHQREAFSSADAITHLPGFFRDPCDPRALRLAREYAVAAAYEAASAEDRVRRLTVPAA